MYACVYISQTMPWPSGPCLHLIEWHALSGGLGAHEAMESSGAVEEAEGLAEKPHVMLRLFLSLCHTIAFY